MNNDLEKRLGLCLFFCRVGVFIVFLVWTLNKFIRPEHGVGIMKNFYLMPGFVEPLIVAFGVFELIMCLLFLAGYFKRFTAGFFMVLAFFSIFTPRALNGMKNGIFDGWHTIMFWSAFCLFACSIIVYVLREYDTRFTLADKNKAVNSSLDNKEPLAWCLFFCRFAVFLVFAVWTYDKFARPEHGVEILSTYYWISGIPQTLVLIFGVIELVMVIFLITGLYKKMARGFFLFLSILAVSVPGVLKGYYVAIVDHSHPTILFFTGFCVLACSFTICYLRDYDTKFSIK